MSKLLKNQEKSETDISLKKVSEGKQAYERMLKARDCRGNADEDKNVILLPTYEAGRIQNTGHTKRE